MRRYQNVTRFYAVFYQITTVEYTASINAQCSRTDRFIVNSLGTKSKRVRYYRMVRQKQICVDWCANQNRTIVPGAHNFLRLVANRRPIRDEMKYFLTYIHKLWCFATSQPILVALYRQTKKQKAQTHQYHEDVSTNWLQLCSHPAESWCNQNGLKDSNQVILFLSNWVTHLEIDFSRT